MKLRLLTSIMKRVLLLFFVGALIPSCGIYSDSIYQTKESNKQSATNFVESSTKFVESLTKYGYNEADLAIIAEWYVKSGHNEADLANLAKLLTDYATRGYNVDELMAGLKLEAGLLSTNQTKELETAFSEGKPLHLVEDYDGEYKEYNIISVYDPVKEYIQVLEYEQYMSQIDAEYEKFCNDQEDESVTLEMVPYVSAADEMEQKQKEKQNKIQQLYKKYGKRYVDAMYNEGKILIGCPEGLILSGVSVWYSLRHESQYQKFYSVTVEPNAMLPKTMKVWVDKRTKKVTSVSY